MLSDNSKIQNTILALQLAAVVLLSGAMLCGSLLISDELSSAVSPYINDTVPVPENEDYRTDTPDKSKSIVIKGEKLYCIDNGSGERRLYCSIRFDHNDDYYEQITTNWLEDKVILNITFTEQAGYHHWDYTNYDLQVDYDYF